MAEVPEVLEELKITDLARGGAGIARDAGGRVVFVPFTAPGDEVRVQIVEEKKRYAQGKLLEVLRPSPLRQRPRCPVFGRCGGCQWQHLSYELQWKTKSQGVQLALSRTEVKLPGLWEEFPAEQIWEYRNRIQLRGVGDSVGFYAAGSHERVPILRCDIARPEINDALPSVRKEGTQFKVPYKVEIEVLPTGALRKSWNSRHAAQGFRQVHDGQNEKLQSWVFKHLKPGRTLLDLYGGSGNLSLSAAQTQTEVHCVDLGVPRTRPAETPANFHFHRSAVSPWLERNSADFLGKPVTVILDPPREGLAEDFTKIAQALAKLQSPELPVELILVGCDPDSWARDLSRLIRHRWKLVSAAALDLFPQTPHVESLAFLTLGL